jgi:hypothetical protein
MAWCVLACCVLAGSASAVGQETSKDLERLVVEGQGDTLDARLAGGKTADDKHLLAQAYANQARRTKQPEERNRAARQAEKNYQQWLEALEPAAKGKAVDAVRLAGARVEYGGMLLSVLAAGELDEVELTAGQRGDRELLTRVLTTARQQYEKALAAVNPVYDDLHAREEELLATGVYDLLVRSKFDATLNLGWTYYYLGVLTAKDDAQRRELLSKAEGRFHELLDSGQAGEMRAKCYLAVGMAQRDLGRLADAEKNFGYVLGPDVPPATAAQARYELARCQLKAGHFDAARATLKPLVDKDANNLRAEEQSARLYVNLAALWDANSYLLEAEAGRAARQQGASQMATVEKARRAREQGLARFKQLAKRGTPWPGLVQLYVAASVDTKTPAKDLSTVELLYTAEGLLDAKKYAEAADRLAEAASRDEPDKTVAGDVLFALGRCQYYLRDDRAAAARFQRMASEYRAHPQAAQAATYAYGLWGKIAERTKAAADYLQLAATLRNLLESYADHPKRDEAQWLLPAALRLAGRFDEAAQEYGRIPPTAPHGEEAQYWRAVCARRGVEAERGTLGAEAYRAKARQAADTLRRYAAEARQRAASSASPGDALKWSADACISAAEWLASTGVEEYSAARDTVAGFETQYPASDQLGRALAVRIRVLRGLREFEEASKLVARFLEKAPPAEVGPTLATLATGIQDEVQRLLHEGQADAARALAQDALVTFEELEKWVRADAQRAKNLELVLAGRAQMNFLAGQNDEALRLIDALLEKSPRSGNFQHLRARIVTARLTDAAPAAELTQAQGAWGVLLSDPGLRQRWPERYWEARYNWLVLALRLGQAADVEKAILQERIWHPDLGGETWQAKFEELLNRAQSASS